MSRAIPGFAGLLVGALTVPLTGGCGPEQIQYDETTIKAADQFRKVAVAYNQAAGRKRKVSSADDLKPFLKEHGDPDALLVSPLDGKPIVVVPGITPGAEPADDDERMIVAYEREGVNGKRMTVDVRGTVVIVSNDDFAKIKFAGGHQPAGR
jgi:hypothetical protein